MREKAREREEDPDVCVRGRGAEEKGVCMRACVYVCGSSGVGGGVCICV